MISFCPCNLSTIWVLGISRVFAAAQNAFSFEIPDMFVALTFQDDGGGIFHVIPEERSDIRDLPIFLRFAERSFQTKGKNLQSVQIRDFSADARHSKCEVGAERIESMISNGFPRLSVLRSSPLKKSNPLEILNLFSLLLFFIF